MTMVFCIIFDSYIMINTFSVGVIDKKYFVHISSNTHVFMIYMVHRYLETTIMRFTINLIRNYQQQINMMAFITQGISSIESEYLLCSLRHHLFAHMVVVTKRLYHLRIGNQSNNINTNSSLLSICFQSNKRVNLYTLSNSCSKALIS